MGGDITALPFLEDVLVLDIGDEATALASVHLAELGARVVRVEDERGDPLRWRGVVWNAVHNAGKQSVAIDTTSDEAWAAIEPMLVGVDVVIGPLEPNAATARFVDRVRAESGDRLGLVEVVFRRDGPREAVTDLTVGAAGGFTVLNGESADPPNQAAGDLAFKQTALAAAEAALALVTARRRTGRAGHIVVSAQEAVAMTTLQTSNGNLYHWHRKVPSRHEQIAGGSTVLSADGQWTSFSIHPPNWPRFVDWVEQAIGPTVLADPEWRDPVFVAAHRREIVEISAKLAAVTTRAELIREGQRRGLLVTPVNDVSDVTHDAHLLAREFFVAVDLPNTTDVTPLRLPGSPYRSNRGRGERRPAPVLGGDAGMVDVVSRRSPMPAPASPTGDHRQALAGIRIVDFTWAIAGALGTRLLADLGADVIKIESENRLDPIRHIGPQPTTDVSLDTNGVFNDVGAGKRAVTINVDTPRGQELVRRLIATADVVAANYTPDRLDRWGFDAATLESLRPGLIVANLAVMGLTGPDAGWRSYGNGLVAMSGIAAHTGFDGRVPQCLGTMHTDFTVPYYAAIQILAALHHRDRTGQGCYLELSQYEASVRLMDVEVADVLNGGAGPGRIANRSPWCDPHGIFPAEGHDRWVAIACRSDDERDRLRDLIGAEPTESAVAAWTSGRSRTAIVAALREIGVPVSGVEDLEDQMLDAPMRELWETLPLPAGITAKVMHEPLVWDGARLPLRRSPMWTEHTYDVLVGELGVEPDEFSELIETRVLW
jgi:crotonobetainyl-CoA:carnitine CoA-transferase CaiB-like acyl-CoA transferase